MTYTIEQLNDSACDVDFDNFKATMQVGTDSEYMSEAWESNKCLWGTTLAKTTGLDIREAFEADAAGWYVVDEDGWTLYQRIAAGELQGHAIWHVTHHKDGADPVAEKPETDLRKVSNVDLVEEFLRRTQEGQLP